MKKIGIVGAGIMPAGMTQNFLKNGYEIYIWNRSPERLQPLIKAGAKVCESPRAVAESADIVIECVSDDEASRSVWSGESGILTGADKEKVLITSASLSLDWTDELAQICNEKNFKFLDMPLTGSRAGAEGATLKLLIGGDKEVLESIRPELEVISDRIYHFGPNGSGMRFKLLLNALQAIHIDAAAQAIELSKKLGLDVDQVQYAIFDAPMGAASPATNAAFHGLPPEQTNFAIKWIEKDLRYMQAGLKELGKSYNLLDVSQTDFEQAIKAGLGDRDWTAIIELYQTNET